MVGLRGADGDAVAADRVVRATRRRLGRYGVAGAGVGAAADADGGGTRPGRPDRPARLRLVQGPSASGMKWVRAAMSRPTGLGEVDQAATYRPRALQATDMEFTYSTTGAPAAMDSDAAASQPRQPGDSDNGEQVPVAGVAVAHAGVEWAADLESIFELMPITSAGDPSGRHAHDDRCGTVRNANGVSGMFGQYVSAAGNERQRGRSAAPSSAATIPPARSRSGGPSARTCRSTTA
jgi:hypothetical protein